MNRIIPSVLALLVVLLALPVQAEEDASPAAEEGSESESEESSDSESGDETKNKKEAEASAERLRFLDLFTNIIVHNGDGVYTPNVNE